MKKKATVMHIS